MNGSSTASKREIGIRLRTIPAGRDLDKYIFTDNTHAREWLAESDGMRYRVEEVEVTQTPCCHRRIARKILKKMSVEEFLGEK